MDRRDFIKSGLLAAAVGAMSGPKAIAQEAERQVAREQLSKDILNYNPQMQYRPMGRTGVNVSALGFGMLRLPMKNGHVDFDQTTPMVRRAIEGGVNYIDTGRVYLGGESEQAVGKALAGGWRDQVYVTSKMPWWEMQSADDFEKFFDQSRRVIGTDVIDFYHIHMIMHRAWKDYVLPYKLIEKMERLKAQGKIVSWVSPSMTACNSSNGWWNTRPHGTSASFSIITWITNMRQAYLVRSMPPPTAWVWR